MNPNNQCQIAFDRFKYLHSTYGELADWLIEFMLEEILSEEETKKLLHSL